MFAPWLPGQVPLVGGSDEFLKRQRQRALDQEEEWRKRYEPGFIGSIGVEGFKGIKGLKDKSTPVQSLPMFIGVEGLQKLPYLSLAPKFLASLKAHFRDLEQLQEQKRLHKLRYVYAPPPPKTRSNTRLQRRSF
jgi:hypothetical protein